MDKTKQAQIESILDALVLEGRCVITPSILQQRTGWSAEESQIALARYANKTSQLDLRLIIFCPNDECNIEFNVTKRYSKGQTYLNEYCRFCGRQVRLLTRNIYIEYIIKRLSIGGKGGGDNQSPPRRSEEKSMCARSPIASSDSPAKPLFTSRQSLQMRCT